MARLSRIYFALVPILVAALLPACSTLQSSGGLQAQASLATAAALQYGVKDPAKRVEIARLAYTAASAVRSLAGGTPPTPAQLQAAIVAFGGPQDPFIALLANSLVSLYAAEFPRLQAGSAGQALATLEAIARGVEAAASLYSS